MLLFTALHLGKCAEDGWKLCRCQTFSISNLNRTVEVKERNEQEPNLRPLHETALSCAAFRSVCPPRHHGCKSDSQCLWALPPQFRSKLWGLLLVWFNDVSKRKHTFILGEGCILFLYHLLSPFSHRFRPFHSKVRAIGTFRCSDYLDLFVSKCFCVLKTMLQNTVWVRKRWLQIPLWQRSSNKNESWSGAWAKWKWSSGDLNRRRRRWKHQAKGALFSMSRFNDVLSILFHLGLN